MELRQLRYLVRTIELGSISQAALDLDVAQSAISLQIQRLEGELSTRLLQRSASGVVPTDAGIAFLAHARMVLRHVEEGAQAARQARLSGIVGVGLAPTTAGILGLPLLRAMQTQYPEVRLHLVEGMSGNLGQMLNARELDLAILFDADHARRWRVEHLLDERLFFICAKSAQPHAMPTGIGDLIDQPLVLPTPRHGLRRVIDTAFRGADSRPEIVAEVDSLYVLMDMVGSGMAATLQPWSALARQPAAAERLCWSELGGEAATRRNLLCCLSDDEMSPAALAVRSVLRQVVRQLIEEGRWQGVSTPLLDPRWGHAGTL